MDSPIRVPRATSPRHVLRTIQPAQVDRTTFNVKAGDVVYLAARGDCISGLLWRLVGLSGPGELSLGSAYSRAPPVPRTRVIVCGGAFPIDLMTSLSLNVSSFSMTSEKSACSRLR